MKKIKIIIFLAVFFNSFIFGSKTLLSAECPLKGDVFPDITLSTPEDIHERSYLGLNETTHFTISDIKAEIVILEIFSMYCPYCQKEAPLVNELYNMINKLQDIKDKIKILGIGAGNTEFEIQVFRDTYAIPFPLISDKSFLVHKVIGEVRTPYFFVIQNKSDSSNTIIYSKVGTIKEPGTFLEHILNESGLK